MLKNSLHHQLNFGQDKVKESITTARKDLVKLVNLESLVTKSESEIFLKFVRENFRTKRSLTGNFQIWSEAF